MAGGASNGFVGLHRFEKMTKHALNRTRTDLVPGNSNYGFDLSSTKGNIIIKWSEKNIDIGKKIHIYPSNCRRHGQNRFYEAGTQS